MLRLSSYIYVKATSFVEQQSLLLMFLLGVFLLGAGTTELALAQDGPNVDTSAVACSNGLLLWLVEGSFGSLIMIVAGIGTLVGAATGAYRTAWTCLVVIIAAFTLRSWVSMFFGWGTDADSWDMVVNEDWGYCNSVLGLQGAPGS